MLLLAVETSSPVGSLSIARLEGLTPVILATRSWQKKASHSEIITLELIEALKTAQIGLHELTHLAVSTGPGSFTGIRVGINLVRSLAFALKIPVKTSCSLDILAFQEMSVDQRAVLAIPAIQDQFYAAAFELRASQLIPIHEVQSMNKTEVFSLQTNLKAEVIFPPNVPSSEAAVKLLALHSKKPNFIEWKDVKPLYVRSSEAEEKLRRGLLKPMI